MADLAAVRTASRLVQVSRLELATKPWARPPQEIALTLQKAKLAMEEGAREVRSTFTIVGGITGHRADLIIMDDIE